MLPEDVAAVGMHELTEHAQNQRIADAAVLSWRVGRAPSNSLASGLSLSEARASEIDMKEFLAQRGGAEHCCKQFEYHWHTLSMCSH